MPRRRTARCATATPAAACARILPVHVLGHPVDMDPLLAIAAHYDLQVIEDATEALGAQYRGRAVGRPLGPGSHAACLSFNGNKLITTGGGGMIITDDEAFARRARYLTTQAKDDPVEYVHHEVGYNYRLTNLQAALGVAQLERLDGHVEAKRRIARGYAAALDGVPGLEVMREASWARSAFWMYTVLVHPRDCAASRAGVCSPRWPRRASRRGRCGSRCTCPPRIAAPSPSTAASPSAFIGRPSVCRVRSACPATRRRWSSRRSPPHVTGGSARPRPARKSRHGHRPIATISCE